MPQLTSSPLVVSAVVTDTDTTDAGQRLAEGVAASLAGRPADVCLMFASGHFDQELAHIAADVAQRLPTRAFIGATGESVVHDDQEHENEPAISLWAAHLPGVDVRSFHLAQGDLERFDSPESVREYLSLAADVQPSFLVLGDPYSIHPVLLLERLNQAFPGRPVFGGLASAADKPNQNQIVFDGETLRHGAAGIAVWGEITIDAVVSQGCRPIGEPLVVTRAQRNVIHELGGRPARQAFRAILDRCPQRDMDLARKRGIMLGRVIDEHKERFERGDFLIRHFRLMPDSDAIVVGDLVRVGQTVQFHVQDAESATEDLESLLSTQSARPPCGALLFTCNGRGTRLFGRRHHDAHSVTTALGSIPIAGLFCAGEIGPVGNQSFLHGHTASVALFRPVAERR